MSGCCDEGDASSQAQNDGKSQAGYIIWCNDPANDENSRANLFYWRSGRIERVVHSTMGAELMAACEALGAAEIIRFVFSELIGRRANLKLMSDCPSLVRTIAEEWLPRRKPLTLSFSEARQFARLEKGHHDGPLLHVETGHQCADGLTKRIPYRWNSLRPPIFNNYVAKRKNTFEVKYGDAWAQPQNKEHEATEGNVQTFGLRFA